jgi:hypothetical protein
MYITSLNDGETFSSSGGTFIEEFPDTFTTEDIEEHMSDFQIAPISFLVDGNKLIINIKQSYIDAKQVILNYT